MGRWELDWLGGLTFSSALIFPRLCLVTSILLFTDVQAPLANATRFVFLFSPRRCGHDGGDRRRIFFHFSHFLNAFPFASCIVHLEMSFDDSGSGGDAVSSRHHFFILAQLDSDNVSQMWTRIFYKDQ